MSYGITHWNGCGDVDTPEHAGCKKRSELPVTLDVGDYAAGFSDGYGRGLTDAARHAIKERVILTDLIAELWEYRDSPDGNKVLAPIIDRAEARLREVTGDE